MYLLFLGIANTVFWYVGLWCNRSGCGDAFLKAGSLRLASLDWLKLQWLSFNVSTFLTWKGWVSEKYQSLTHVALWVYGPLMTIDETKPFEEPTDKRFDTWFVVHYRKWLEVRGLSLEGNKKELREKVRALRSLLEDQPKCLPKEYGDAEQVLQLLQSMVLMMTTLLQPAVEGESHTEILRVRIRMFLSALENFEIPMR